MDKWRYNNLIEKKTLWEKKKLLGTSNFFFSHNVFKSCLLFICQNEYLWSKGLNMDKSKISSRDINPLPHMPILSSSDSAANRDNTSKIRTNGDTTL